MNAKPHSRKILIAVSMLSVLLVAGCVSVPKIEADGNVKSKIKRIALLPIGEPQNVQVVNIGGTAGAFGLIGGLVQGTTNVEHSKKFVEAVKSLKPTLSEALTSAMIQGLKSDGYDVVIVSGQKPKLAADHKSLDFSDIKVDADAILAVWFGVVGYMSSPYSTHYEPWVAVRAQMVDAQAKKDVYFKLFCIGYKAKIENSVPLPADPRYRFTSFDDIMAHSGDAFHGLVDCAEIAAKQISSDLKN
jgi:hypothetical protein